MFKLKKRVEELENFVNQQQKQIQELQKLINDKIEKESPLTFGGRK